MDGTLITGVNFTSTVESTLKRIGCYSEENVRIFLEAISSYEKWFNNYNKKDYLNYFGRCLNVNLDESFLRIFFDELKTCVPLENTKLKNAIVELSKKYELVLLTNYFKVSQLNRLHTMGIDDLFSACYGEELIKLYDKAYLMACGDNLPEECVMIGDHPYLDIEKAQSVGINTIWVNSKALKEDAIDTLT